MPSLVFHRSPDPRGPVQEWLCSAALRARKATHHAQQNVNWSRSTGISFGLSRALSDVGWTESTLLGSQLRRASQSLRYDRLNRRAKEIRVIHIEPGRGEEPICCHVHVIALADRDVPEYEALSYCWRETVAEYERSDCGSSVDEASPLSDNAGYEPDIPRTALTALLRLRYEGRMRLVWIDALCINQRDIHERNSQVALMGLIYTRAIKTVAWLGQGDGFAEAAVMSLQLISGLKMTRTHYEHYMNRLTDRTTGTHAPVRLPDGCSTLAINSFFEKPWHVRAWVQQEVALARDVVVLLGDCETTWQHASETAFSLSISKELERAVGLTPQARQGVLACSTLGTWLRSRSHHHERQLLRSLLTVSVSLQSTDPRDKVYGLLGLTQWDSDTLPEHLEPDYRKPVETVYRDATKAAICESQDLAILSWVQHHRTESSDLSAGCTWSITFESKTDHMLLGEIYDASNGRFIDEEVLSMNLESERLRLKGLTVGKIRSADFNDWDHGVFVLAFIQQFVADADHARCQIIIYRLLRVLAADCNPRSKSRYNDTDFGYDVGLVVEIMTAMRTTSLEVAMSALTASRRVDLQSLLHLLMCQCRNRTFIVSDSGLLGLGPPNAREGDEVVVLFGGKVPFVLRAESESTYRFVGDCYVEDIMDGEALRQMRTERPEAMFELY